MSLSWAGGFNVDINKLISISNPFVNIRDLFYMECVREPPEWFLWVWHSGSDIDHFVVNIRLFKVGHEREAGAEER